MKPSYLFSPIGLFLFLSFLVCSCAGQSTPNSSNQTEVSQLDKLISTYAEYGKFNGTILVAKEGKVMYQKGLGLANMEWNVPNQPNTKFRIGSITKQFTALLIMQLVAEKRLDLHTPISTYLPDYPEKNGDQITLHHLLTHTSGIPNSYSSPTPKINKPDLVIPDNYAPKQLVSEFSSLPLEFTPGQKFSYCNAGYTLLGFIIETVTKKTYQQVLQDRIFTPLNMKNTGFEKHRAILKNRASGYFKSWGDYYNANYVDMSSVYAAGALYSTVEDLYLWDQALYTEKLLPKKYRGLLFTAHIPDPDYGGSYGYGWSIKNKLLGNSNDHVLTISHDGVIDGFCAILTRIPSSKSTVILLSNVRRAPLNAMTKGIMGILYKKPYDFPKKSVAYSILATINKEGIAKGIEQHQHIKNKDGYYLSEDEMNIISYKLLQSDRAKAAAEVLKLGINSFPKAFNLYDSYGEVLLTLGDTILAIKNYKRSIELNPENKHGLKVLKELAVNIHELEKVNTNLLKADSTWGQEIFIFPIHFAPEIQYEGVEDIRFAPGWAKKDNVDFWTYVFAWRLNIDSIPSEKELKNNLTHYFDGLMKVVNKDKDKILPKTTLEFFRKKNVNQHRLTGTINLYDAFTTKKPITLYVQIDRYYSRKAKKAYLVFKFSPKEFDQAIWKELNEIKLRNEFIEKI